jgi:hypothetical protein
MPLAREGQGKGKSEERASHRDCYRSKRRFSHHRPVNRRLCQPGSNKALRVMTLPKNKVPYLTFCELRTAHVRMKKGAQPGGRLKSWSSGFDGT